MSTLGQFVFHSTVSQFRGLGSKTRRGGKNEIDYKSKILFTLFLGVLVDDERNSPRSERNCGEMFSTTTALQICFPKQQKACSRGRVVGDVLFLIFFFRGVGRGRERGTESFSLSDFRTA